MNLLKNTIWLWIFCLTFASCYEDDAIIPTEDPLVLAGNFEFPQGDNPWDQDALEIYQNFGIKLIYKDIQEKDLNKSWTGGGLGPSDYKFDNYTDNDMIAFHITFLKNHVFPYINREVTARVLPMYWYLVFNYYICNDWGNSGLLVFYVAQTEQPDTQIDSWVSCFWGDVEHCSNYVYGVMQPNDPIDSWKSPIAGNKESYAIRRFKFLNQIIQSAIDRGNIVIPIDEFDTGFDHSTPIITSEDIESKADPNYYLTRGYPGFINSVSGKYDSFYNGSTPSARETFLGYLQIAMRLTKAEREEMWPSATYPFMSSKFDFVTNYMKKYDIDVEAMAQGPQDWDITPYPQLPETDSGEEDDPWAGWDW